MTMTGRTTIPPGRGRLATPMLGVAMALGLTLSGTPGVAAPTGVQTSVTDDALRARGNPKAFNFLDRVNGEPVHWNPCAMPGWRINLHRAPKRAIPQAKEAMQRIKNATGLRFRFQGKTGAAPRNFDKYPKDTDLVMGWGGDKATGGGAGVGGPLYYSSGPSAGKIINGYVVLNYTLNKKLANGFGRGPRNGYQGTKGQLMMHELAHAVGLKHVKDRAQIMYPTLTRKKATWGAGDRNGLRKVGKAAGCF